MPPVPSALARCALLRVEGSEQLHLICRCRVETGGHRRLRPGSCVRLRLQQRPVPVDLASCKYLEAQISTTQRRKSSACPRPRGPSRLASPAQRSPSPAWVRIFFHRLIQVERLTHNAEIAEFGAQHCRLATASQPRGGLPCWPSRPAIRPACGPLQRADGTFCVHREQ